jgi:hypothetical protein
MEVFAQVPDPRDPRGRRHDLATVLTLAQTAVLAGSRTLLAIAEWTQDVARDTLSRIGISPDRALPSESTIRRALARVDANDLDVLLAGWMATRVGELGGKRVIAYDGKTMRGARTSTGTPHLLAAFDHAAGAVVGQLAVATKSNEIPALRDLLNTMDITGSVITADAMHCQRETASHIIDRDAHYVLTVKDNQCATRRSDVYPPQAGGTRREVLGSDDLPGAERRRGQQHVRKPSAGSGCLGRRGGKTRTVWQRLDCLNSNLQRQQFTAAGTASVTGLRRGRDVMVRPGRPSRRKRCPVRASKEMSGVPAAVLDTYIGDERGITVPALWVGGDGVLVVVVGVTSGRGGRESRPQGEGAQVGADHREPWRYA